MIKRRLQKEALHTHATQHNTTRRERPITTTNDEERANERPDEPTQWTNERMNERTNERRFFFFVPLTIIDRF